MVFLALGFNWGRILNCKMSSCLIDKSLERLGLLDNINICSLVSRNDKLLYGWSVSLIVILFISKSNSFATCY